MMIIIGGVGVRKKKIDEGDFFCPRCGTTRHYERKRAKRYFTLYFIPLIPMGDIGEFIECTVCHGMFEPVVLNLQPPKRKRSVAQMLNDAKIILESGTPVEYYVRDLTQMNLDRDIALNTVKNAIGTARNICPTCNLTYAKNVHSCSECGGNLDSTTA